MLWESSRTPDSRIFFICDPEYTGRTRIVKRHPLPPPERISHLAAAPPFVVTRLGGLRQRPVGA
jgi:hypothetical protein